MKENKIIQANDNENEYWADRKSNYSSNKGTKIEKWKLIN